MVFALYLILALVLFVALVVGIKAFRSGLLPTLVRGAPYLATNVEIVKIVVRLAKFAQSDTLIDLGSGDGRLVLAAAEAGVKRAIGYEIDPIKVAQARRVAADRRLMQAVFYATSFWNVSWAEADVVFIYSLPFYTAAIEEKLKRDLKPGARVITFLNPLPGWTLLAEEQDVRVYQKT